MVTINTVIYRYLRWPLIFGDLPRFAHAPMPILSVDVFFCFRKYSRFRARGLHVDQLAKSLRFVWRRQRAHTYTSIQFSISFHIRNNSLPFFVIYFSLQFGSAFLEVGHQLFCLFVI